ncbi:MAG: magnesium/cobalt transporter CorA [Anaerolineales bacterium]
MISLYVVSSDGWQAYQQLPADLPSVLQSARLLWLDFESEPAAICEPILRQFGFHPLAIDDALQESHIPKVDDWGAYLYIALHALQYNPTRGELATEEVDIFLGTNYIVTHHDAHLPAIEHIRKYWQRDIRITQISAAHLTYLLADEIINGHMHIFDEMEETINTLEDGLFAPKFDAKLEQIFTLKRSLLTLRRILGPQRETINRLARAPYAVIPESESVYFRDIYDHLVRLYDITESARDLLSSTLDTYLSVVNNRMNEVMKTLTIITTLFMPLSFLTGFFGMNFFQPYYPLPAWTQLPAFLLTLTIMLATPALMFLWMRRRSWM